MPISAYFGRADLRHTQDLDGAGLEAEPEIEDGLVRAALPPLLASSVGEF